MEGDGEWLELADRTVCVLGPAELRWRSSGRREVWERMRLDHCDHRLSDRGAAELWTGTRRTCKRPRAKGAELDESGGCDPDMVCIACAMARWLTSGVVTVSSK